MASKKKPAGQVDVEVVAEEQVIEGTAEKIDRAYEQERERRIAAEEGDLPHPDAAMVPPGPHPRVALAPSIDVQALMARALDKGADGVDALDKLVALNERVQDRQAKVEFNDALRRFQSRCPEIPKTAKATILKKGGGVSHTYNYAELDAIVEIVRPLAYEEGLSFRWDSGLDDKGRMSTSFILSHVAGHSETSVFTCPVDTSARMSEPQKHAAALTFGRRQSLIQGLGLTTTEPDTDAGLGSDDTISESQAADLRGKLDEVRGPLTLEEQEAKFCEAFDIPSIDKLLANDWLEALRLIERKRRRS